MGGRCAQSAQCTHELQSPCNCSQFTPRSVQEVLEALRKAKALDPNHLSDELRKRDPGLR